MYIKFIYSEKATNFCKISTVDLSYVETVKSTVEISQNFVAFSEYMNFKGSNQNYFKPKKIITLPILKNLTPLQIGQIKFIIKRGVFCKFQSFKGGGGTY